MPRVDTSNRAPLRIAAKGDHHSWTAVVEKAFVAYTAFLADGTPVGGLAMTRLQIIEACTP